jgi:hypothetical protein
MDTIRAKFKCTSVTKQEDWSKKGSFQYSYKFSAVTSGSKENENFWKYTPAGSVDISAIRDDLFEVGKEYYVDFSLFIPIVEEKAVVVEEMVE